MKNNTRVIVSNVRFSYLKVWEPDAMGDSTPKYSASLLVDKEDKAGIARIRKAIENAKVAATAKFGGSIPKKLDISFKDGDEDKDGAEYEGKMYINAKSDKQPGIVDAMVQPIIDQNEIYSGCYGNAAVTFYGYNYKGKCGVAASLDNIQMTMEGEPLGAPRHKAEDDFEAFNEFM